MERELFSSLLRDVLANIRDYEVLEKHALSEIVPRSHPAVDKADNLRSFIWEGIKSLKPSDESGPVDMLKWRYYNILSGRYIQGLSTAELQKDLALGERQERRMHNRAVNTLEEVLWDRLFSEKETEESYPDGRMIRPAENVLAPKVVQDSEEAFSFSVSLEPLHLDKIIDEIAVLFLQQLQARRGDLSIQAPANLPMIQADRIILRQILLYLFNQILQCWFGGKVFILAHPNTNMIYLEILAWADPSRIPGEEMLLSNPLFAYWLERLNARLSVEILDQGDSTSGLKPSVQAAFTIALPMANQSKILVVDDHAQAIRIIELYLSETNIQTIGINDPTQVLHMAQSLHPNAVLLDVMMPAMDGWEILQNLKSDPETHHIPVIVCSVWDQPDLANILGADSFIKKPINKVDLLKELVRLHLMDTPGE